MIESLILILKGSLIGVANIIPGVSGGTLAITLGLYERLINAITTFFKDFKNNIKFLITIGIGAAIGFLLVSKLILLSLDNYPLPTNIFFISLILGGMPSLFNKVNFNNKKDKNILITLMIIAFFIGISFLNEGNTEVNFNILNTLSYIKLFAVGIIGAATMVIPGISGSFILILLGYYRPLLNVVNNLLKFYTLNTNELLHNLFIIVPFALGLLVGILLIAKLIEYLLKQYETPTYYAIIGFVIGSVFMIIKSLTIYKFKFITILISIIVSIFGFTLAYLLGEGDNLC